MTMKRRLPCLFLSAALLMNGCTVHRADLGSADNPVKFYIVPSVDVQLLEDTSKLLRSHLEKVTPYKFKVSVPPSFIAVVEAFGTGRADVASINPYGYVLAHERYGVEARLVTERFGESTYKAQYVARADGPIKAIQDLAGKKIAFVDPSSVSGFLLPMRELKESGIKVKSHVFAMRHDNVITMVYQRQVDAGATFYSPPAEGKIQDARRLVIKQFPDVEQKVRIIGFTREIPNDPIVFRKNMPEEMKKKIIEALIGFAKTPEGREALKRISSVTGLRPITDKDYDSTRATIRELGDSTKDR
jgi:phosphonate transport system substrate-binding protein